MFSLTQMEQTSKDCTARYLVNLDKKYTLQEFVDAVLSNNKEWGRISILKRKCSCWKYPNFRYRNGEIIKKPSNIPKEICDYQVQYAGASGGWGRMDYIVILEKEVI